MEKSEELQIITECQHGETEEFTKLYEKYVQKIYSFIFHKTLHKETSEDLTSEVFLKAIDKIKNFDPEKSSFQTWLFTLARNRTIDFFRTNKTHDDIDDIWDISSAEEIEDELDIKFEHEDLHKHLQNLTAKNREILMLRFWQDLSYKEIAEITGMNEGTARMAVSRSIKQLKAGFLLFLLTTL